MCTADKVWRVQLGLVVFRLAKARVSFQLWLCMPYRKKRTDDGVAKFQIKSCGNTECYTILSYILDNKQIYGLAQEALQKPVSFPMKWKWFHKFICFRWNNIHIFSNTFPSHVKLGTTGFTSGKKVRRISRQRQHLACQEQSNKRNSIYDFIPWCAVLIE
jgi:hypothetical protein